MSRRPRLAQPVLLVLTLAACVDDAAAPVTAGRAPLIGDDGGADTADRDCRVVLRTLARPPGPTGGFEEHDGGWIWRGSLEVATSDVAAGAMPAVAYQYGSDPTWWEATAVAEATDDAAGLTRFAVQLDHGLPGPGMSGSALASARVRVAPLLRAADGARVFDHNRRSGDLDSYDLVLANGFAVVDDPATCAAPTPPVASVAFAADWEERQEGAIVAGGQLLIHYDLARLTTCRGSHNGYPAWNLEAVVRYLPGGQQERRTVRAFHTIYGHPTSAYEAIPALFAVPADARGVDVWFENSGIENCLGYDSNEGQDYRLAVTPPPSWVGDAVVRLSRATDSTCDGGAPIAAGFDYDTWVRQRAAIRNVCLQAWAPGVTDRGDPEVWRALDVRAHYRFAEGPFASVAVPFDQTVGDNARFAWPLAAVDPFATPGCVAVPTQPSPDGQQVVAEMDYYFTINGVEHRPAGRGSRFHGHFSDASACP